MSSNNLQSKQTLAVLEVLKLQTIVFLGKTWVYMSEALITDILWSPGFLNSVFTFCSLHPIYTKRLYSSWITPYFYDQKWTSKEIQELRESNYALGAHVSILVILHGTKMLTRWAFRSIIFFWGNLAIFSACWGLLLVLTAIFWIRPTWFWSLSTWLISRPLVLMGWLNNAYFGTRSGWVALKIWIKQSPPTRAAHSCIKKLVTFVLWEPTLSSLDDFQYKSINPDGIRQHEKRFRLLRVRKRIPFLDLRAELCDVSLATASDYEAISYVWGTDQSRPLEIQLDGKRFNVSTNVYNLLWRRSSYFRDKFLWIDSICIDQSNNREKCRQVKMMQDIYRKSFRVVVCLGDTTDDWLAVHMLHELIGMSVVLGKEYVVEHILLFFGRAKEQKYLDAQLKALLNLFHHPWFNRVWIVQEVVVAGNIIVQYGGYELSWEYLLLMVEVLTSPTNREMMSLFQYSGQDYVSRLVPMGPVQANFMQIWRKAYHNCVPFNLSNALRNFSSWQSTNPRDKIFALLGLTSEKATLAHIIDYNPTTPISDILFQVAKHFHEQGKLLSLLQFAGIGWDHHEPNSPSWVVNWTKSFDPTTLAESYHADEFQYRSATQIPSQTSLQNTHLIIRGRKVSKIRHLGSIIENRENQPSECYIFETLVSLSTWVEENLLFIETHALNPYPTNQPFLEIFWRILIGDRTPTSLSAPSSCLETFQTLRRISSEIKTLWEEVKEDIPKMVEAMQESKIFGVVGSMEGMQKWLRDAYGSVWILGQSSFQRKVAVTEEGWVGVMPKGAEVGDEICLMFGAQVPFVLRQVAENEDGSSEENVASEEIIEKRISYQLVGECYLHGFMNGEGLLFHSKDEDFEII